MSINLTLIGQLIAFGVFVWFCMKFVWPPIMNALDQRTKRIADGLAAAEEGQKAHARAEEEVAILIKEAKEQAHQIVSNAEKRGNSVLEEARENAKTEGERIIESAKAEIDLEANRARDALRGQVAGLTVAGAGKVLGREIDEKAHADLIDELVAQL